MYKRKNYKRKAAPYKKRAIKRTFGVKKLARQIKRIRTDIKRSTEVKEYTPTSLYAGYFGQVDANLTGTAVMQLNAMEIPAGVDDGTRIGKVVKFIGMHLRIQFLAQSAATSPNQYIVDVFRTPDFQSSDAGLRDQIYETDSISGVVDYQSTRNKEFLKSKYNKDGIHTLIASRRVYMGGDQFSGQNRTKDIKMFIKQKAELSYNGSSNSVPNNYRYFVVFRAANGNRSASAASTLTTVPYSIINTGCVFRMQMTNYFTDM